MQFKFILLFITISLCSFNSIYSQVDYQPQNTIPRNLSDIKEKNSTTTQAFISSIDDKKDVEKSLIDFYQKRENRINANIADGHYIFDEEINSYFNQILEEIVSKNASLNIKDINLLISRYPWPNASCLGDGTIVFNIGLIRRLENEDQAAFVICHELAHYYLNHVDNNVKSHYQYIHSKELKKEINQIKKSEYKQYQRATELLKGLVYDDRKHSRLHEGEADSLGFVYMKNTKYNLSHALSALEILDEIDQDKFGMPLNIQDYFSFEDYPFRERWLAKEEGLSSFSSDATSDSDWDADSLKTHPDCEKRIEVLSGKVNRKEVAQSTDSKFAYYSQLSDFEIIQSKYDFGTYGSCIYHALQLLQKYPDHFYLEQIIAKSLVNITQAQLNHEFAKCVAKPHPRQHDEYELFLNFLQNLRLRELSLISYHYIEREANLEYLKDEDFLFSALMAAKQAKMEDAFSAYKKQYKEQFPKGKYNTKIQNL